MEFANDFDPSKIFANPEQAAYYSRETQALRNYIYSKYQIDLASNDPMVVEYLVLNEFFGKFSELYAKLDNIQYSIDQNVTAQYQQINDYHIEAIKLIEVLKKESQQSFINAANSISETLKNSSESLINDCVKTSKKIKIALYISLSANLLTFAGFCALFLIK